MADYHVNGSTIEVETDCYTAQVKVEGYVSGVAAGTFVDKKTGARELGFGLDIVDFLLEPGPDNEHYEPHRYRYGDAFHGDLPKRYVELPQICTQAKKLDYEVTRGKDFVAVRQWFNYTTATVMRKAGSHWEQTLVFADGKRYFFASDCVRSVNDIDALALRIDMPGHVKHNKGDTFAGVYLSYAGEVPSTEFLADFPPHAKFLYQRGKSKLPRHMIRAYQIRQRDGSRGPWLAGITLDAASVYEAWCHQRGYVCFIEEIGGRHVRAGEEFGAAYVVGYFDSIEEMDRVSEQHRGAKAVQLTKDSFRLIR